MRNLPTVTETEPVLHGNGVYPGFCLYLSISLSYATLAHVFSSFYLSPPVAVVVVVCLPPLHFPPSHLISSPQNPVLFASKNNTRVLLSSQLRRLLLTHLSPSLRQRSNPHDNSRNCVSFVHTALLIWEQDSLVEERKKKKKKTTERYYRCCLLFVDIVLSMDQGRKQE
jgi:hypothetical protein